ncbi:AAA family ATPase [Ruegeria sp. 2205SS24-7]|uniref:ATP-binding protein n=1 Tax=Ruegeria discodermiae TaxID=3064389 RepID=UPI0027421C4B|nr:AAA family ATPase [Ruegeria sp. 2205SS24-7]MDP5220900.1 AAA family ATPase [Ruegeria sp. 2205SS24-7]
MDRKERLEIRLIGRLEIRFRGRRLTFPIRHAGFLLAILALESPLRRDVVASRLWGERSDEQARASLRQTIYHVQKVLDAVGAPGLVADRVSIALDPEDIRCDVWEMLNDLRSDTMAAAAMVRADLLGDLGRIDPAFEEWLSDERRAFEEKLSANLTTAAQRSLDARNWKDLDAVAIALLKLDPYDEVALRLRMDALAHMGRRTHACALFDAFQDKLASDLKVMPDEATLALRDRLASVPAEKPAVAPTSEPEPLPTLHERRSISILAVAEASDSKDPEEFAAASARLRGLMQRVLQDGTAVVLDRAGAMQACVFGATGLVERHAEAAVQAARAMIAHGCNQMQFAVVSGDIVQDGEIDTSSVAHLLSEAAELMPSTRPGEVALSTEAEFRMDARREDTPFVARLEELDILKAAFAASRDGHAQVVGVVGEAGIGKSTLLRQFLSRRRNARVLMIEGREREVSRSFGAITRFLRTVVAEDEQALERALASDKVLAQCAAAIAGILGLDRLEADASPEDLRRQIFDAVSAVVLTPPDTAGPTILVVEDLHWLDSDTAEFLDRLVGEVSEHRLLILATFRPEHQVGWIGRSSCRLLRLAPLMREHAMRLVSQWFEESQSAVLELVLDRAEGNPFFLVELARASSSLAPDGIPGTIRDVLLAHIHRRPVDARRVLQCAAVLGVEMSNENLATLSGFNAARLDDALLDLRKDELLLRTGTRAEPGHRFRHALLYDTVYTSITKPDLRSLHHSAFKIAKSQSNTDPSAIAHHAWQSENWSAASIWWCRAGDNFAQLSSYTLAAEAYGKAILALDRDTEGKPRNDQRVDLALRLRPVLVPLGRYHDALAELDLAEDISTERNNTATRIAVQISKSYLFSTHGRLADAIDKARQAKSLSKEHEQQAYEATLAEAQARSLIGDWHGTLSLLRPTLPFWEANRHERFGHTGTRAVWCHGHLSNALCLNGLFDAAAEHAQRAFDIATETQRPLDLIFSLHRLGRVHMAVGNQDEALALLEDAVQRTEDIDAPIFRSWFACDAVPVYLRAGRLDDARNLLDRQMQAAKKLDLVQFEGWLRLRRAEHLHAVGQRAEAAADAQLALSRAIEIGDLVLEPAAMMLLATCSDGPGGPDKAAARELAKSRGLAPALMDFSP